MIASGRSTNVFSQVLERFSHLNFTKKMSGIVFVLGFLTLLGAQRLLPTPQDIHTFYVWMEMGFERGIFHIYQWTPAEVLSRFQEFSVNYPPLVLFLYPAAWILKSFGWWPSWPSPWANIFFRLPLLFGHFFVCLAIFKNQLSSFNKSQKWIWAFLLMSNPAFLIAGPVWGQLNFLLWGFIALSFIYFERGEISKSACYAVLGALTKPQFIMFLPSLLIVLVASKNPKKIMKWAFVFLMSLSFFTAPWLFTSGLDFLKSGYSRVSQGQYSLADIGYGFWWTWIHALKMAPERISFGGLKADQIAVIAPNLMIGMVGLYTLWRRQFIPWVEFSAFSLLLLFCFLPGMNAQCLVFGTAFVCLSAVKESSQRLWGVGLTLIQAYQLAYNAIWTPHTRLFIGLPVILSEWLGALCFIIILIAAIHFARLSQRVKQYNC